MRPPECGSLLYKYAKVFLQTIYQQSCFCVSINSRSPRFFVFFQHLFLLKSLLWSCGSHSSLRFRLFGSLQCSLFMIVRRSFEISDHSRMRMRTKTIHPPLHNRELKQATFLTTRMPVGSEVTPLWMASDDVSRFCLKSRTPVNEVSRS